MPDFFEQSINNYSGLSIETKPTIAAGNNVPNGSRWREVDTNKVYFFNSSDDTWYEMSQNISIEEGVKLQDESGVAYGVKQVNNKPRVSSMPYLYDIAEGNVPDHTPFQRFGFNDTLSTSEETIWSHSSQYVWPTPDLK